MNFFCKDCPIRNTQYCHAINPMAPKYNRAEKMAIREQIDKGQTAFKEANDG